MDDVVEADEKAEKVEDWKKKYCERIKIPSIHYPEPSFPLEGAIDPEYKASLGIIIDNNESEKTKKTKTRQRYRNSFYAKNLIKVIRMIEKNDVREEFFRRAKFPTTLLQDKDISPIIEEFMKV
ncbi:30482_t:CDS:2, partial [Gigaspora margarita]